MPGDADGMHREMRLVTGREKIEIFGHERTALKLFGADDDHNRPAMLFHLHRLGSGPIHQQP